MTSIRSLIRLALKKGIKNDFRIIDFVSIHPDCRATKNSVKEKLNEMIETNEVIFNVATKQLSLHAYPINKDEGKTIVSKN